ncbi:DMT family transporter [Roseovarius sp. SCSIO 43702]|uniref:DMT family transporter n=1 Tax=Roseovarius sp. SCSIO 43702 TaxID=2823043 RepID=UPI001C72FA4E|nr:DMT family transporter [Roseovarius sp. SCSIO 43702]QYX57602.1 DMT family transporter [Roseovarius sp. SCSIO 43702]
MSSQSQPNPALGIAFMLIGITAISVNDTVIKFLSGGYPLHQMVFVRSAIGICFSLTIVQFEGGWSILRTARPGLHILRGLMIVVANMSFFTALAALSLAETTAIFFISPLLITLLSIPFLGEKVGPYRIGAVIVGLIGVIIVTRPWAGGAERDAPLFVYLLPIVGAFAYATTQLLTRKLGVTSRASALAVYLQGMFLVVGGLFWLVAGDGRYATQFDSPSMQFLFRAWTWPVDGDLWLFVVLGLVAGVVGYCMSAAYRMSNAATVAPFEYTGLPLAIFWGWVIFGDLPDLVTATGIALILASGLFVFLRERQLGRPVAAARRTQKRM